MKDPILRVVNLKKYFPLRRGFIETLLSRRRLYVRAVDGISFNVGEGKVFCLAGESGCGKTTTARLILRLIPPTDGKVYYKGVDIFSLKGKELKRVRQEMQMIFQDPYQSLNPRMRIFDIVNEPLDINRKDLSYEEKREIVYKALEDVRLDPEEVVDKFPHELSGGERQRVAIARALVLRPRVIVADEPVSMLDASIRVSILNLLMDLKEKYNLTMIYITHDLAQVRYLGDDMAVMYLGKIVEMGPVDEVLDRPVHPYTQALISNVPIPDPTLSRKKIVIRGEVPSPVNPPPGCRFHPRCPYAREICRREEPKILEIEKGHYVACHLYE
ncbi:MAG: oligopeptide ABC transporter ATP-binding protein [Thermoprotei archaeon]|nr:MAG: oligopeptide ABC transporter ATP-binding protein [Thermoprotei archaeon]RLF25363.1 MAG: oligopeptide ABC transporter ATP-binding protein [Thermoprotei archaeon]